MKTTRLPLITAFLLFSTCSNTADNATSNLPTIEVDMRVPDTGAPDLGGEDMSHPPGERVALDLTPHLPPAGGSAVASIVQLETDDAPFSGDVSTGRTGDWMLQNDVIRVLIEGDKRAMSPCPWGGTPIDAAYIADGGDEDILGEVCALLNGGSSMRPDLFEVLHDGSDGGAVVLAVSGNLVINDFLNLPAMVDDFLPNFGERISFDVNAILPLRVTTYYVLAPGESNLLSLMVLRNDTDAVVDVLPLFLVASGGDGYYFNPASSTNGFGASGGSLGAALENLPFLAFNGERASYAFAPKPTPKINADLLPLSGSYLVISGVAATALGITANALLPLLTAGADAIPEHEDILHVAPHGGIEVIESRLFVGDGSLATMVDRIYEKHEVATGTVEGVVQDEQGTPIAGARVTALRRGFRAMNQAISGPDGRFSLTVPPEDYELRARRGAWSPDVETPVTVTAGAMIDVGVVGVRAPGTLRVRVTTPDDGCDTTTGAQPVPARLTVICADQCDKPSDAEADTQFHGLPQQYQAVVYGGNDGVLELELPAGDYQILVSRGMEWSIWPPNGLATPHPITIAPSQLVEIDAEIARVIDTGAAYSGDFHVHSVSSPDSTVEYVDRVLNFAAEGVDVLVATDHDHITDHRPIVTDLTLDPWIQAVVGNEITTADLGHFNAFPLVRDATHGRGGATDWGNGEDFTHTPDALYALINAYPGEQVIQMNHAGGLGFIKSAKADVLRGITYANREKHRLPPQTEPGKTTDDTGFWSDGFTAMELMNGNAQTRFYRLGRWWMQMIGRGFAPTGTAVTDTHKLYADLGGVPRTYVGGNADVSCGDRRFAELADYDAFVANFAEQTNAGNAVGTNGPFFDVWVDGDAIDRAGPGETAATNGAPFVAHLDIQTTEWINVHTIDVYLNPPLDSVNTRPGQLVETQIPPQQTIPITWDEATHLTTVRTGDVEHKVWRQTIEIPLESADDAFLIFVLKGGQSMAPVTRSSAFAFSNPIFIDADGNGYDNPPYADAASMPPGPSELPPGPQPVPTERLQPSDLIDAIRELDCQNPLHGH